jgi:hypothetical protein
MDIDLAWETSSGLCAWLGKGVQAACFFQLPLRLMSPVLGMADNYHFLF